MRRVHNPFFELFPWLIRYSGSVPELYWNIQSDEQRYRYILEWMYATVCDLKQNDDHDAVQDDQIRQLFDEFETFMESGFDDYYAKQVCDWINENMPCIIGNAARFVQFGLTENGYLVATIPNNWDFLEFDTVMDAESEDYGRLTLTY